jgi:diguanylate cyclase (GGDEF)-like protein
MAYSYRQLAYEDPITRGPNRRAFDERLASLADSPEAARVTILMLDLDRFKQVNDNFVESILRDGDFAARLGGDEFASLLPHTEIGEGEKVAARILAAVRTIGGEAALTATIGRAPSRRAAPGDARGRSRPLQGQGGWGDSIGIAEPD